MLTLLADVVWPALFLEMRLLSWWVILIGLLVEWPFVRLLTRFPWKRAFIANAAMNAASTVCGILLLPLAGLFILEPIGEATFYHRFHVGTFNPATWAATFLVAVVLSATIEFFTLRIAFKQRVGARGYWWLCVANSISAGLAFWSFFHFPPRT
jgi:hypothetical protein